MFGDILRRAIGTNPEAIQGNQPQQHMGMIMPFMQQPMQMPMQKMPQRLDMFGQSNSFSNILRNMGY